MNDFTTLNRGKCNCRNKNDCPLNGECLTENVLYETEVTSDLPNYTPKTYRGITAPKFKLRYANHKQSFACEKYANSSELSKEVWKTKRKGYNVNLKWKILRQCPAYNPTSKRCLLCLSEKLSILEYSGPGLLNKRTEIVSTCRHKTKYQLKYLTSREAIT